MDKIKEKAEKLGITDKTVFLGSREDVNWLYSAFDALLFPSHYEGLPVTLVEAQAADLPCLISDRITIETDINPNLKRMSLDKDADEWAVQLEKLVISAKRMNRSVEISNSGFDIHTTAEMLTEIYK